MILPPSVRNSIFSFSLWFKWLNLGWFFCVYSDNSIKFILFVAYIPFARCLPDWLLFVSYFWNAFSEVVFFLTLSLSLFPPPLFLFLFRNVPLIHVCKYICSAHTVQCMMIKHPFSINMLLVSVNKCALYIRVVHFEPISKGCAMLTTAAIYYYHQVYLVFYTAHPSTTITIHILSSILVPCCVHSRLFSIRFCSFHLI